MMVVWWSYGCPIVEMHRACTTARFAFPKCTGLVPQQDLLFRNAQGLYHSKICFSEMHRACTTARFAFPKCEGLVPQQDLLFRNAQGLYHSKIRFPEMRRACTTARFAFLKCALPLVHAIFFVPSLFFSHALPASTFLASLITSLSSLISSCLLIMSASIPLSAVLNTMPLNVFAFMLSLTSPLLQKHWSA
jgi:hypothetical protein